MRGIVAVVAIVLSLSVAGCAPGSTPVATPAQNVSSSGVLASSDKAFARARVVYEAFIRTSAMVSQERGENPSRLQAYLTKAAYVREEQSIADVAKRGLRTTGAPRLVKFEPQSADLSRGKVSAYACVDFSKVRVQDKSGKDITPDSRPSRQTSNPTFVVQEGRFVMVEDKTWRGASIC